MITRRQILLGTGATLLAAAMPILGHTTKTKGLAEWMDFRERLDGAGGWPWKPRKISSDDAAMLAYLGYYDAEQGCCFGVFKGLVGQMALKYGKPYSTFPIQMMSYGASGTGNWGTLCGALNGAAAAFGLFYGRRESTEMIDALFRWYEKAELPGFKPSTVMLDFTPPPTVVDSALCHVSVSKWCYQTGNDMHSNKRTERCARVTGDVAGKAAEIINDKILGKNIFSAPGKNVITCKKCHDKGRDSDIAKGKMDCGTCHDGHLEDQFEDHF